LAVLRTQFIKYIQKFDKKILGVALLVKGISRTIDLKLAEDIRQLKSRGDELVALKLKIVSTIYPELFFESVDPSRLNFKGKLAV